MTLYARRRATNYAALAIAMAAAAFGLFWLITILWTLTYNGVSGINLALFTEMTPPPGSAGGLLNAIFGSLVLTIGGTLIGTPVGMMAGTYLAEYGKTNGLAQTIRFINDILLSAPSIVVGLFVYEVVVAQMGHFSAWAGVVALAIIGLPVMVRTTEDMLNLVPQGMKDASTVLGVHPWRTITSVIYPAARSGILTGLLLAVARISGETAPLLFTALNNQFFSTNLNAPIANLPVVIFLFALSPYQDWQQLAWSGALLITFAILALSIAARLIVASLGPSRRR